MAGNATNEMRQEPAFFLESANQRASDLGTSCWQVRSHPRMRENQLKRESHSQGLYPPIRASHWSLGKEQIELNEYSISIEIFNVQFADVTTLYCSKDAADSV